MTREQDQVQASCIQERWGWGKRMVRACGKGDARRQGAPTANTLTCSRQSLNIHHHCLHAPPSSTPHVSLDTWQLFICNQKPRASITWSDSQRTPVVNGMLPVYTNPFSSPKSQSRVCDQTGLPTAPQRCPQKSRA